MDSSPTPETPPKNERGQSSSYLAVFAVTLSLLSIAVAGFSLEAMRSNTGQPVEDEAGRAAIKSQQARIAKLERALDDANAKLDSLRSDWEEQAIEEDPVDTQAIETSLDAVKEELSSSQDAIAQDISRLDTRISEMAQSRQEAELHMLYSLLRARVESGQPYGEALGMMEKALTQVAGEQDLGTLFTHADEGIATPGALYAELQAIRFEPEPSEKQPVQRQGSWWQQTRQSLSGLVKVERVEAEVTAESSHDTILTAAKLGDIATARAIILALPNREQRPYETWLDASKARLDVLQALDMLAPRIMTAAAPAQGPATDNAAGGE